MNSNTIETLERRRLLAAAPPTFVQTNLVSDGATPAATTDQNLMNPWGIAPSPNGDLWVSDNATGLATVYPPTGGPSTLSVMIPPPAGQTGPAAPTGVILHTGSGFNVSANGQTGPSLYLFATEDGTISGWNQSVDSSHAILAVDNSVSGAVYKGLAVAGSGKNQRLYVANFNSGMVDVFDSSFHPVTLAAGAFSDTSIPAGFAPFNVASLHGKLYVTYAKQNDVKHDDVEGPGNGFVDVYTTRGKLVQRLASGGVLDSPWAVSQGIGRLSGDILVGNFGDGHINVFSPGGRDLGSLNDSSGNPIVLDGLWDLITGQGRRRQTLYFAAGTNHEADGLFGAITPVVPVRAVQTAASAPITQPTPMPIY